ncbi:P-loop containing nucleoside triphosphate hydrolase protein [Hyaloraphidium curvatum]|nr:P-loop containing nucleoside triphosphate hydrolase protein [Hyaloraphidium curvatum]
MPSQESAPQTAGNAPLPVIPATKHYLDWLTDSKRWEASVPRKGDIVISTYPKSGTTWTQRIVDLLVFQDPSPRDVMAISPWLDMHTMPEGASIAAVESQAHRRFVKTHTPAEGVPLYDDVKYLVVVRDPRDACMSWMNHLFGLSDAAWARISSLDETVGHPFHARTSFSPDPADFFAQWLSADGAGPAHPHATFPCSSYANHLLSWWRLRTMPNVLLMRYEDRIADLEGGMRQIAAFLGIPIDEAKFPALGAKARFGEMKRE